jgi:hypothetical protein
MPAWADHTGAARPQHLRRPPTSRRARLRKHAVYKETGESSMSSQQPGVQPERIDLSDEQAMAHWAEKLDATPEQIREAVDAVGDQAADVEMHLKGARSTSNSDRVRELGG